MDPPPEHGEPLVWTVSPSRYVGDHQAHASISLPLSGDLYFIAEGSQIGGHFEVSQTEERGSALAVVDIEATYHQEDALDTVVICHLAPRDGKHGVGIFRNEGITHFKLSIQFHVHVRLPAPASNSRTRLMIGNFTTDLPLFSHHLHRLAESVFFDNIVLVTSQCAIQADSLAGRTISLRTSNAAVSGVVHTTKALHIGTSNARVSIHAGLLNDEPAQSTRMTIETSNGPIETNIRLASSIEEEHGDSEVANGGSFDVIARTSNAPLTATISEQHLHAQLNAALQTQNAPVRVKLHPAFEGHFDVRSSVFSPPNISESFVGDPAGMGRRRSVVRQSSRGGVVSGSVLWEPRLPSGRGKGRVKVQTSNAPLHFLL